MIFEIFLALSSIAIVHCGLYTVTEEVWFDVEIQDLDGPGEDYRGRFVVAVFGETVPMTAMNFIALARGYNQRDVKLHYKDTPVHRVVRDFVIQMGDVTARDGTGGASIYGEKFNDENFELSHRQAGMVSMANHGKDTNGAQFFILLTKARWLDNSHVVFGKVIRGMDVVNTIGEVEAEQSTSLPRKTITIVDCGVVNINGKYDLTEEQIDSTDDV